MLIWGGVGVMKYGCFLGLILVGGDFLEGVSGWGLAIWLKLVNWGRAGFAVCFSYSSNFFIKLFFSSTRISSPLLMTPILSAISSASSI